MEGRHVRCHRPDRPDPCRGCPRRPVSAHPDRGQRHIVQAGFTVGRQGTLVLSDEFASGHHARFTTAHGLWYVEDLGSTNGTWLNGRRIHAPQRLKKGDKIKIGHTIMTVMSA